MHFQSYLGRTPSLGRAAPSLWLRPTKGCVAAPARARAQADSTHGHQEFRPATVLLNEALNLQDTARLIHLTIEDNPQLIYGRKVQGRKVEERWIDR